VLEIGEFRADSEQESKSWTRIEVAAPVVYAVPALCAAATTAAATTTSTTTTTTVAAVVTRRR